MVAESPESIPRHATCSPAVAAPICAPSSSNTDASYSTTATSLSDTKSSEALWTYSMPLKRNRSVIGTINPLTLLPSRLHKLVQRRIGRPPARSELHILRFDIGKWCTAPACFIVFEVALESNPKKADGGFSNVDIMIDFEPVTAKASPGASPTRSFEISKDPNTLQIRWIYPLQGQGPSSTTQVATNTGPTGSAGVSGGVPVTSGIELMHNHQ